MDGAGSCLILEWTQDHFLVELSGSGLAFTLACDSARSPSQLNTGNVCLISKQGRKSRGDFS